MALGLQCVGHFRLLRQGRKYVVSLQRGQLVLVGRSQVGRRLVVGGGWR